MNHQIVRSLSDYAQVEMYYILLYKRQILYWTKGSKDMVKKSPKPATSPNANV